MQWCGVATILLVAFLLIDDQTTACGPGRGAGRRRGSRRLTPLVFKQHVPNVPEQTLTASGLTEGPVTRNDPRFLDLEVNYSNDVIFKDEEGTGADRLMTMRLKEKLNTLAISVMNQWPGVKLVVIEGWDEDNQHSPDSLHYEGRAVDIMTSDRERSKLGMLARLAIEAGFDWVYYESKSHIHCSVKSESSQAAKYGGCFTAESTVLTSTGIRKPLYDLKIGEHIFAQDPKTKKLVFSEVIVFLDYNPEVKRAFLNVTLKSGRTLIVTPNHLVAIYDTRTGQQRTVYVDTLNIDDKLLVRSGNDNNLIEESIVMIKPVFRTGVFSPLTEAGTVVVNGVLASCYASIDNQYIAHLAFAPVRLLWNFENSMRRIWTIISQPLNGWQTTEYRTIRSPSIGVYWYAKLLYATAQYFIPLHLI